MRIVAGKYGGRRLESPKDYAVRPTTDKVRGAIFNALQSRGVIEGAQVMDLFCGGGGLGLEALSRGAVDCVFVDSAKVSLDLTKRNAASLDAQGCAFLLQNAQTVKKLSVSVDLVFIDPPYNKDLVLPTLVNLHEAGLLMDGAVVVVEAEKNFSATVPEQYEILDEKIYGDTKVLFLEYTSIDQAD